MILIQNLRKCKYIKLIQQNYIIIILSIFVASAPFIGALIGKYSVKTMTRDTLINNEFIPIIHWDEGIEYVYNINSYHICIKNTLNSVNRKWNVCITDKDNKIIASVNINTIEQFNMLMKLMDINFRIKEE